MARAYGLSSHLFWPTRQIAPSADWPGPFTKWPIGRAGPPFGQKEEAFAKDLLVDHALKEYPPIVNMSRETLYGDVSYYC